MGGSSKVCQRVTLELSCYSSKLEDEVIIRFSGVATEFMPKTVYVFFSNSMPSETETHINFDLCQQ